MVKTDLFTSSHVHFRRIEPNKCFIPSRIGMFLQEPSRLANTVERIKDYFDQKIGIKPRIRPLDLQGELISKILI